VQKVIKIAFVFSRHDLVLIASVVLSLSGFGFAAAMREAACIPASVLLAYALTAWAAGTMRSSVLQWLLSYGMVVGLLELGVDWFHVAVLQTFAYSDYGGCILGASPWYMPIAWCMLMYHSGYMALRLYLTCGRAKACFIVAVSQTLVVAVYEQLAIDAGAWNYRETRLMLGGLPLGVLIGYLGALFICALTVSWTYRAAAGRRAVAGACVSTAGGAFIGTIAVLLLP
jgi:hypothetical protein